jgi:preprotein translocase subunit SecG
MQSGRGGGLTETFQSAESMFGTQTNVFMVRTTTILAVIFLSTSMILAFNSSQVTQSLMANKKLLATVPMPQKAPKAKEAEGGVQVKVGSPKPMAPAATAVPSKEVPVSPVTNAKT